MGPVASTATPRQGLLRGRRQLQCQKNGRRAKQLAHIYILPNARVIDFNHGAQWSAKV